ncbi:dUTPase-like protein [Cryptosporidium parvum]|uniref:dUTPase-like domain-containing protein n=1 Tax=Cryptosporidium parvum TaxID=5807 RepID=A0A7S7LJA9_CRYPV|nr:dUTPase-like protein [Cryptosporidium parvum]WRK30786.1 dUTPase-like protein [Cryptosporidium parvum]|eukprot:QOY43235.1 hypothetical protein CPATCC_000001 [Cryptosporidium parvum]
MRFLILPLTIIAQQLYSNHTIHYKGDSGLDLFIIEDQIIKAGETGFVRTGLRLLLMMIIMNLLVILLLAVPGGIFDAGFRGELRIPFDNIKDYDYELKIGQRYVSLTGYDGKPVSFSLVDQLDETDRGERGLGSTGLGPVVLGNTGEETRSKSLNQALVNETRTSLSRVVPLSTNRTSESQLVKSMKPLTGQSEKSLKSRTPLNSFIFPQASNVQVFNIMSSDSQALLVNVLPSKSLTERVDIAKSVIITSIPENESRNNTSLNITKT